MCTANICRSASAQQLLRAAVAQYPELAGIEVRSAGTAAMVGASGCRVAPALVGQAQEHRSQQLTPELVAWADLILTAARDHRPPIAALSPAARSRMFTIRQAGRIADWIMEIGMIAAALEPGDRLERYPLGDPRRLVPDLPEGIGAREAWLVAELDAARGMAPATQNEESAPAASPLPDEAHVDDVLDPHVLGMGMHQLGFEQLRDSTDALVRVLREVAQAR